MIVEWFVVFALYTEDGSGHVTYRKGFPTKEACESALRIDKAGTFGSLPAAKGHCLDFPVRPAGLPDPQPAPKKGAVNA